MARRVKKRTQKPVNASAKAKASTAGNVSKTPKSMVIRVGASQVGSSVSQLVKDVRLMMEPDTAVRLKVRYSIDKTLDFSNHVLMKTCASGTQIQQIEGLYSYDWTSRCLTSYALLEIGYRKYQHASSAHSSRTDSSLPRRELFVMQRRRESIEASERWRTRSPNTPSARYEQLQLA